MKKIILVLSMILSFNLFAKLNDGKYEVIQRKNNVTYTMKIIIKNSKILFIDYDKINENGVKESTKNTDFRDKKEKFKKDILANQNYDKIDAMLSPEYVNLFKFLIEKSENSKNGEYEL